MSITTLPLTSPLYEAYSKSPQFREALNNAVDKSALSLGDSARLLFTFKDKNKKIDAKLAA